MKCEKTGKKIFEHKRDAQEFINKRHNDNRRKRDIFLREYPCPDCAGWHVTKKPNTAELVPRSLLNLPIQHETDFKKYLE